MRPVIYLGLIISLITGGCAPEKKPTHIGAWQLISSDHWSGDTLLSSFPVDYQGSDIIIFSERHLLSVGLFKSDTSVMNNYVGATYTLEGNHFEKTLLYSPNPDMVGKNVKQIFKIRNDTLIKTYPCDNKWELVKREYFIEKFMRLE